MLSARRKNTNIYSKIQSFSTIALKIIAESNNLPASAVQMLICMNTLQLEINTHIGYNLIKSRTTFADNTIYKGFKKLLRSGFIEKVQKDRYNVTVEGRLIVMVFNTEISRMVNETKLSKWNRLLNSNLKE